MRENDYDEELLKFNIPPQLVVIRWRNTNTLEVKYDQNEELKLGGGSTELDLSKDTLKRNGVTLLVIERKNKINDIFP